MSIAQPPTDQSPDITTTRAAATPTPMAAPSANPNLLRDRLANERTFLAWLRTGIGIASLGFVVARFDIFLHELAKMSGGLAASPESSGITIPLGVVLVLAGPSLVVIASVRFMQTEHALMTGHPEARRLVRTIIIAVTAGVLAAGGFLAVHLSASWPG